ncbi:hypothetical protein NWI01_12970 [Nitrobacter winogradskyi]|uniref:Uncharacterized protein n=1 Tax=Nitrobacter winogradskyi TaxID=913 RepID=A0A4Y3W9X4_NITWI|nr:hypothetical protein NWI01_12970 [Nitrobacter winogradskyi]
MTYCVTPPPDRIEAFLTNIVQVGGERELVGCLPDDCHIVEITQSTIRIDTRKHDRRDIGIFRADVGRRQHSQRAVHQIESNPTVERRSRVVVAAIEAVEPVAEGRIHAGVDASINIEEGG